MVVFTHPGSPGDVFHDAALPSLRVVVGTWFKSHKQSRMVANCFSGDNPNVIQTEQIVENLFLILQSVLTVTISTPRRPSPSSRLTTGCNLLLMFLVLFL